MPGMPASLAPGIREAVGRSAIEVHAPVDAGRADLVLERRALVGRDEGILGADAHEHSALDVLRILGPGGLEPEWKPTTAFRSAPPRASSSAIVPPKQ